MKRYRLYDLYEGKYMVGEYDTLSDAKNAAKKWDVEETDGECLLALKELVDGHYYYVSDFRY